MTCESFWNVCKPGTDAHCYVHIMRKRLDVVPERAFVLDGENWVYIPSTAANCCGSLYTYYKIKAGYSQGVLLLFVCLHRAVKLAEWYPRPYLTKNSKYGRILSKILPL